MEALSVREYRNNLAASFTKADNGEQVLIRRKNEIIRWEDQGKTVIEGDADSEISKRFFELAEKLLEDETERVR